MRSISIVMRGQLSRLLLLLYFFGGAGLQAQNSGDLAWSVELGAGKLGGAPLLVDHLVVVGDEGGVLHARRRDDGEAVWRINTGAPIRTAPVLYSEKSVLFGDEIGRVFSVSVESGLEEWRFIGGKKIRSSPALLLNGLVVFGSHDNFVYSLDGTSGKTVWKYSAGSPVEVPPVVGTDGAVYVTSSLGGIHVLDPLTGQRTRTVNAPQTLLHVPPAVDQDGNVWLTKGHGVIEVLDPTGNKIISKSVLGAVKGIAIDNINRVRILSNESDGTHRQRVWELKDGKLREHSVHRGDGWIDHPPCLGNDGSSYVVVRGGKLYCLRDGSVQWNFDNKAPVRSAPILGGQKLFFVDGNGVLKALNAGPGNWPMLAQNPQRTSQPLPEYLLPGETVDIVRPQNGVSLKIEVLKGKGPIGKAVSSSGATLVAERPGKVLYYWLDTDGKRVGGEGSLTVSAVPRQAFTIGEEISVPKNADDKVPPTIEWPDGKASRADEIFLYWDQKQRRLYAAGHDSFDILWTEKRTGLKFVVPVTIRLPKSDQFQLHIAEAPAVDLTVGPWASAKILFPKEQPEAIQDSGFAVKEPGISIVMLSNTDGDLFGFEVIRTVSMRDPLVYLGEHSADIGEAIDCASDFPGKHDPAYGSPWVKNRMARYCSSADYPGFYDRAERKGPIIPVNRDTEGETNDDMFLVLYTGGKVRSQNLKGDLRASFPGWRDEARFYHRKRYGLTVDRTRIAWPTSSVQYECDWPEVKVFEERDSLGPDEIVIAAQTTRPSVLAPSLYKQPAVYRQADPTKPGYNPNEEHAFIDGNLLLVCRSDLNDHINSSEPYTLVAYQSAVDAKFRIKVYHVVAEDAQHTFRFQGVAGNRVMPPQPLSSMVGDITETCIRGPQFLDRKGELWAKAAGNRGGVAVMVNQYHYRVREEFDFADEGDAPGKGELIPWLGKWADLKRKKLGLPQTHAPVDVTYDISWPRRVPVMKRGQTLTVPNVGLPDIIGQKSVGIVYDQGKTLSGRDSAVLIDAIRIRRFPNIDEPSDELTGIQAELRNLSSLGEDAAERSKLKARESEVIKRLEELKAQCSSLNDFMNKRIIPSSGSSVPLVERDAGKYYFPSLPPHLRKRFYYDSENMCLAFEGLFLKASGEVSSGPAAGEISYPLLNVLTTLDMERYLLKLSELEEFQEAVRGFHGVAKTPVFVNQSQAAVGRALTSGTRGGVGYLTLVFNNSVHVNDPGDPISMEVIRISDDWERGELVTVYSENPFSEKVVIRHSGEFAGETLNYEFDWRISRPGPRGIAPNSPVGDWPKFATENPNGAGDDFIVIEGANSQTLRNNFVACRYRLAEGSKPWPDEATLPYTVPRLVNGWLTRVRKGINPFDERIKDFRKAAPTLQASMLQQAGVRFRGAAPLNEEKANDFGLIEIYETVLRRGKRLSIDAGSNDPDVNKQLQSAARSLSDLYMLLGNEAYSDASDPTIVFSSGLTGLPRLKYLGDYHAFMGLGGIDSLIDEELSLLRGFTDANTGSLDSLRRPPLFNRIPWNTTAGDAKTVYMLNYGIRQQYDGLPNSDLSKQLAVEDLAKKLYPQGHGDAYGHYLTALTVYYQLLHHPEFDWQAETEAAEISATTFPVGYFDERKFAGAAAAKARAGVEIVDLTYRRSFDGGTAKIPALELGDSQGVIDWAAKAGQGAYIDWLVGNSLIPEEADQRGPGDIDRGNVPELAELPITHDELQAKVDLACRNVNPIGIPDSFVPLDIKIQDAQAGKGHFDQQFSKATQSLVNATQVLSFALEAKAEQYASMQRQAPINQQIREREIAFKTRLIEVYGSPYNTDIGAGRIYPQGYDGPDLIAFAKYSPTQLLAEQSSTKEWEVELRAPLAPYAISANALGGEVLGRKVKFQLSSSAFGGIVETNPVARRKSPGEIQMAHGQLLLAVAAFNRSRQEYGSLIKSIEDQMALLRTRHSLDARQVSILDNNRVEVVRLNQLIRRARQRQVDLNRIGRRAQLVGNALANAVPGTFGIIAGMAGGVIGDPGAPIRGAAKFAANAITEGTTTAASSETLNELDAQQAKELAQCELALEQLTVRSIMAMEEQLNHLRAMIRQEPILRLQLYTQLESAKQAAGNYSAILAKAERLEKELTRFRAYTASGVRNMRYRDMGFRMFRDDAIQKYRKQFDVALRDAFLAARTLEYTTNWADDEERFDGIYRKLVGTRTLGAVDLRTHMPVEGTSGIAEILSELKKFHDESADVMGLANPIKETHRLSMRYGYFRGSRSDPDRDEEWRARLREHVVDDVTNLAELKRYCRDLEEGKALVIPFSTPFHSSNKFDFFGWPKPGGGSSFSGSYYNTRISDVNVSLQSYKSNELFANPQLYLIPVGTDTFRTRLLRRGGQSASLRTWQIEPYVLPIQSLLGSSVLLPEWSPFDGQESAFQIRKMAPFTALTGDDSRDRNIPSDRQLFGRAAYNSRWLLVIPFGRLGQSDEVVRRHLIGDSSNPGVTDIVVILKTSSIPGF